MNNRRRGGSVTTSVLAVDDKRWHYPDWLAEVYVWIDGRRRARYGPDQRDQQPHVHP